MAERPPLRPPPLAPPSRDAAAARHRAGRLGAALPALLAAAERVAATVASGLHGRRRTGQGEAFWQYRRHQPDEPAARIDWRQSARADALFVRENEWAAAESVWLGRDGSPSMSYRSDPSLPTKRERADLLLLATASLLLRGGERVALLGSAQPPAGARHQLQRIAEELDQAPAFRAVGAPLPRHAKLVLISDFLEPDAAVAAQVADYAGAAIVGHLVHIVDPAEPALPFTGRVRFDGLEGEDSMLARRVERLRETYQTRWNAHCAMLADLARSVGWSYRRHVTDQPPAAGLLAIYGALAADRRSAALI